MSITWRKKGTRKRKGNGEEMRRKRARKRKGNGRGEEIKICHNMTSSMTSSMTLIFECTSQARQCLWLIFNIR